MILQLSSEEACKAFLKSDNVQAIAEQLRRDKTACQKSRLPSPLVLYMPSSRDSLANDVALELFPEMATYPKPLRMAQYNGMITVIKSHLQEMRHFSKHEALPEPSSELPSLLPTAKDIETALNVLDFSVKTGNTNITLQSPLQDVLDFLRTQATVFHENREGQTTPKVRPLLQKKCYICQYALLAAHPQYSSLCNACGEYNLASSAISIPPRLHLEGKTALVTGGRINLGYHTALRLLRCRAHVIVSTRYHHDAEQRYISEPDFKTFRHRFRVVGADFRAASDVFKLVNTVKECLTSWTEDQIPVLDILINNAAQTLTDSVEKEEAAIKREAQLRIETSGTDKLLIGTYSSRVRAGVTTPKVLTSTNDSSRLDICPINGGIEEAKDLIGSDEASQAVVKAPNEPCPSSWLQSIQQIPYEDIISAHSVNTFVPLILIREFLPIMRSDIARSTNDAASKKAASHIINVSSREGIFEATPKSASKHGKHVHTNLTKAALNMLTETEVGPAWRQGKIAMNTVDPGFMSAAAEVEEAWREKEGDGWTCPIGWEDGAGRLLWPIAMNEGGNGPIWGRFLKHFGAVEIDVSVGR